MHDFARSKDCFQCRSPILVNSDQAMNGGVATLLFQFSRNEEPGFVRPESTCWDVGRSVDSMLCNQPKYATTHRLQAEIEGAPWRTVRIQDVWVILV